MLALTALVFPGFFRARIYELGRYLGIRQEGQLVAMAGERFFAGRYREISAVCTHPDSLSAVATLAAWSRSWPTRTAPRA